MFKCLYIFSRLFFLQKSVVDIRDGLLHFHNNYSLYQTGIPALPFRQNLSQTGIQALLSRHNFVSYISITTQPYIFVLQLHKCVRLVLNFGLKSLDHRFCFKVFSLNIYIVKVSHYFEYYKKNR